MTMTDIPPTVIKSYETAACICRHMDDNEFRIVDDPQGSGGYLIEILDEETGDVVGKL